MGKGRSGRNRRGGSMRYPRGTDPPITTRVRAGPDCAPDVVARIGPCVVRHLRSEVWRPRPDVPQRWCSRWTVSIQPPAVTCFDGGIAGQGRNCSRGRGACGGWRALMRAVRFGGWACLSDDWDLLDPVTGGFHVRSARSRSVPAVSRGYAHRGSATEDADDVPAGDAVARPTRRRPRTCGRSGWTCPRTAPARRRSTTGRASWASSR